MTRGPRVGRALTGENGEHISGHFSRCSDTELEKQSRAMPRGLRYHLSVQIPLPKYHAAGAEERGLG